MRAPAARRHAGRDRLRRRSGRDGAALGGRRGALPARRRPRRRGQRRAGERATRSRRCAPRCRFRSRSAAACARSSAPARSSRWAPTASSSAPRRSSSRTSLPRPAGASRGRVAVGIDARDGKVAVKGWTETSAVDGDRAGAPARRRSAPRASSTPTSSATARSRASTSPPRAPLAEAVVDPGHRLRRRRLARRHRGPAALRARRRRRRHRRPRAVHRRGQAARTPSAWSQRTSTPDEPANR